MRKFLSTIAVAALIAGCSQTETETKTPTEARVETPQVTETGYDLAAQYAKFAPVEMNVDYVIPFKL